MAFRIRFYCESNEIPKPLLGNIVFDAIKPDTWKSRSMEGDSKEASVTGKNGGEEKKEDEHSEVLFYSGNPEIDVTKGVLRLYKDNKLEGALESGLPSKRSDIVCLLAVPAHYSSAEICRFLRTYTKHVLSMRILRDQSPDRLVLVMRMIDQEKADSFYLEFNGIRFNSVEPERCKVAFLSAVEFLEPREAELFAVLNQHEMPSCPVCLERLEEQASGIYITLCNHSFHCSCLAQWNSDSSCPVCRYTHQKLSDTHLSKCDDCLTQDSLWICLICGHVGCSRYREMHAQAQQIGALKEKMLELMKDNKFLKEINTALESDQARWKGILARQDAEAAQRQQKSNQRLAELEEQVRDLMFYVEAQKAVSEQGQDNLEEGSVVTVSKDGIPRPNILTKKKTPKKKK